MQIGNSIESKLAMLDEIKTHYLSAGARTCCHSPAWLYSDLPNVAAFDSQLTDKFTAPNAPFRAEAFRKECRHVF
jgi:hypothetical protein